MRHHCDKPRDVGWCCLRETGHTGPCAAVPEGDPEAGFMPHPDLCQPPLVAVDRELYMRIGRRVVPLLIIAFLLGLVLGLIL